MIPVTKPYLPSRAYLERYIDGIYERHWLTNDGPLVQELTRRLEEYLGVENLLVVSNGTLALQIAYRVLGVSGGDRTSEAITTPFSFVATASSLRWEGVKPVFADIDSTTWCLDPDSIESRITPHTRAIVPVHVFGNGCDVEKLDALARRHRLKVIYDGAHAFGVKHGEGSLLRWGDACTLSFHATKLFHCVEGGAIVFKRKQDLERAKLMINFGISGPDQINELGINAKMNEFQAAMGLSILDEIDDNLQGREAAWRAYASSLKDRYQLQRRNPDCSNNHAYFPILFKSEAELLEMLALLKENGVMARRYFYPALDTLDCFHEDGQEAASPGPVAFDISKRILCLPLYSGLDIDEVLKGFEKKRSEGKGAAVVLDPAARKTA